jgi:hypothetical protein
MKPDQRIVTRLPIEELWNSSGPISTIKVRDLDAEQIRELLRTAQVRIIVAELGAPLKWIPNSETYDFWKQECKPRLADPDAQVSLEDFPGEYCYFASEWEAYDGAIIVLLERMD